MKKGRKTRKKEGKGENERTKGKMEEKREKGKGKWKKGRLLFNDQDYYLK